MKKKKVLFVLPSLQSGGAEKVITTLLKLLNRESFELHLAVISNEGPLKKNIPIDVYVHDLKVDRVRKATLKLMKLIRELKPDVIFSTLGHLNLVLILLKSFLCKNIKLIVREAFIVSEGIKRYKYSSFWELLYKKFYKKADLIITQSDYMSKDLHDNFNIPKHKLFKIYNPVEVERINEKGKIENPFKGYDKSINIVAIGRLSYEKGYDRLLKSIPELLKIRPQANLWILGSGPLETELEDLTIKLGIHKQIHFVGYQENPYKWLKHADLFVLASYYEGLPNALLEAVACGCPVIAINSPGGTKEILDVTGQTDRLINDFTWEQEWFVNDKERLDTVYASFISHFDAKKIVEKYEKVLLK